MVLRSLIHRCFSSTLRSQNSPVNQPYHHPMNAYKFKPLREQLNEIYCLNLDNANFHNEHYQKLLYSLKKSRTKYAISTSQENRNSIATEELAQWMEYVETRSKMLPEKLKITGPIEEEFKDAWYHSTDRETQKLTMAKMLDFHYHFATKYKMRVPIDPKNLAQMIHPHYGYLISMPGEFEYEDMMAFYTYQLVSTMERLEGQTLLAEEITALSYWLIVDKEAKGYLGLSPFIELLKGFRENIKEHSVDGIRKEYKFLLKLFPNELLPDDDVKFRFDFARRIFLERCAP